MRSTIRGAMNQMAYTIQQNTEEIVVTIPRRVTFTEVFPVGLVSCFYLVEIATRNDSYWFISIFVLLALVAIYSHYTGEQLVFRAGSIKHRLPLIGFHITNQKFRLELVSNLRIESRQRWGGLFRNDDGIAFTYKSRIYRFGNRMAREDAEEIIRIVSQRYPQLIINNSETATATSSANSKEFV
jgi:hypothetical protein